MPIEREFKYVLDHRNELEAKVQALGALGVKIQQGYLSKGGRIRSKTYPEKHGFHGMNHCYFTYKHKLSGQPGCLEIEQLISDHDFSLAWLDADHIIDKVRYEVTCDQGFVWEIDFFKSNGDTYFALAECEVQEHQGRPEALHDIVNANLVLAVDEDDNRFQNRKLSNVKKVSKLFRELTRGR